MSYTVPGVQGHIVVGIVLLAAEPRWLAAVADTCTVGECTVVPNRMVAWMAALPRTAAGIREACKASSLAIHTSLETDMGSDLDLPESYSEPVVVVAHYPNPTHD